jgi:hypothetical protein
MKIVRLATTALLVAAFAECAVYGQYREDARRGSPPGYDDRAGSYGSGADYDHQDDYDDYDDYPPSPRDDVGFFYDELSPYGDWVLTRQNGWAWFPRNVRPSWRPYSDGRWVTTEYGWTWASNEPFGWATYHYGRWAWEPRLGWLWVPGTTWGPAWVSWRSGEGYIGWAPLPPAVGFEVGVGIRLNGFDLNIGIRPDAYSFVAERSFLEPRLAGHLVASARNVTIIRHTTNVTDYSYSDNRVVNRGIDVRRVEQVTGRRVRPMRLGTGRSKARTEVAEKEVWIYRPERRKLDTVRVGSRPHAEGQNETPRLGPVRDRPAGQRRDAPDFAVAPRADRAPRPDVRQSEKQELREQQELQRYQTEEKRELGKVHDQEIAKARPQAGSNEVETHHKAEREALQQEQQAAQQQLTARQQAQRRATQVVPPKPPARGEVKADDPQQDKNGKGRQKQQDKGRVRGDKPPASPPA